jgi:hypothetical protein
MATIEQLENIPCTKGYIFAGQKIYGDLPTDEPWKVELLDVHTEKVHVWHRHSHTVFAQEKQEGKSSLRYETSNQMLPCPDEAESGYCPYRFNPEHRKFHYHYCHGNPQFYQGKPVCKYSKENKENICWERFNSEHNKRYHHFD